MSQRVGVPGRTDGDLRITCVEVGERTTEILTFFSSSCQSVVGCFSLSEFRVDLVLQSWEACCWSSATRAAV